jgi:hypothetical protein
MYAVLQNSLEQCIDRGTLEEAVMATEELSPPDCARLVRELFGIVATNLSEADALALQSALQARQISTEVVEESALPVLPLPRHVRALNLRDKGIELIDLYNQMTSWEWPHIVFAAGGGMLHLREVQKQRLAPVGGGRDGIRAVIVTRHQSEKFPEFRLELFLPADSPRAQWVLTRDSVLTVNDTHIRLRDEDQLASLLAALGNALAPEQINFGIKRVMANEPFTYPSVHAFEEEIIWSLYRMTHPVSQ